ncbi:MAG TPA: hypothetical protein VF610_05865 [Segetibacter sp.]|jgi:hypothetical protein
MKRGIVNVAIAAVIFCSCAKKIESPAGDTNMKKEVTAEKKGEFLKYTIAAGQQYCDRSVYEEVTYKKLMFTVKFDSSAIYKTIDPANQGDINKLFGFSDNKAQHHLFSARFGWRWSNNALRLFGYVYNDGIMSSKELGTIAIGTENACSIEVKGPVYIFRLNGKEETMPRTSATAIAEGYRLYPYFGGDELAPHEISIWIKEERFL